MAETSKRRRLNEGHPSQRAQVAVGASHDALQTAFRESLAEARATAIVAARIRRDAQDALTRAGHDVNYARARAFGDARGVMAKSAAALATAKSLLEKLRVTATEATDETEAGKEKMESVTSTAPGGGRVSLGIMSLPDCILERIYAELDERDFFGNYSVYPCPPTLRYFAFSCRRFANLFRGSYVRRLSIDVSLRPAEDQLVYLEDVDGALGRFPAVEVVHISGIDCVSRTLFVREIDGATFCRLDPDRTDFILAVDARKLIAATAARGWQNNSKVSQISFGNDTDDICGPVSACNVSLFMNDIDSVWKWREEKEQWLYIFPNVATVEVSGLVPVPLCAASRLCGPARANLKKLIVSPDALFSPPTSTVARQLSQFCNIKTLVISDVSYRSEWKALEVRSSALLEKLPRLQNLGVICEFSDYKPVGFLDLVEKDSCPLLKYLLRALATTVDRNFSVTVWSRFLLSAFHDDYLEQKPANSSQQGRLCDREVKKLGVQQNIRKAVFGDTYSQWIVTEGLCYRNVFDTVCQPRIPGDNDVVLHCRFSP